MEPWKLKQSNNMDNLNVFLEIMVKLKDIGLSRTHLQIVQAVRYLNEYGNKHEATAAAIVERVIKKWSLQYAPDEGSLRAAISFMFKAGKLKREEIPADEMVDKRVAYYYKLSPLLEKELEQLSLK